jgi:hypothetical protein
MIFWLKKFCAASNLVVACFVMMLTTQIADAATVTKRNLKRRLVDIDAGTKDGFKKGTSVCFSDAKGKQIGCGKVQVAKANSASVKVGSDIIKKIKNGFSAEVEGAAGATVASGHRTNIKGLYTLTAVPSSTFNKLSYATPEATEAESLWNIEGSAGFTYVGGGAEVEFAIGKSMSLALGGRYRMNIPYVVDSNYGDINTEYALNRIEGNGIGGYLDFYFLEFGTAPAFFRFSTGLDFDMSTVTMVTEKLNDDESIAAVPLFKVSSTTNIISLRLGMQLNLFFKPIGLVLNATPIIPLAAVGGAADIEIDDPHQTRVPGENAAATDVTEALNHTKNNFGAEVSIGLYFAF